MRGLALCFLVMFGLAGGVQLWAKPQSAPEHLLRQYDQLQREGRQAQAEGLRRRLTEYYGDHVGVQVALAREAMRSGEWEFALAMLAEAGRSDGQALEVRMARAEIYRRQKRISEALQELETALRRARDHELADRAIGLMRLMQGQWEATIVHLTRHLNRSDGQDADAYCWRGLAWLRSGRPAQAEADFARALQLVPDLPEIWLYRAQALEGQGKLSEAVAAYARYLAESPQDSEARLAYAKLLQQLRRPSEVLKELRLVLQQRPNQREVLELVLQTARQTRQYHLALEVIERLISLDPANAQLWLQKSLLLDLMYRDKEALAALDEYEKLIRKNAPRLLPSYYARRANAYRKLGRLEEALQSLNTALDMSPSYGYAYYLRADVYWRLGKVEAALADLDTAEKTNNERYPQLYIKRAEILRAQGKWDEALKQLDRAVETAPTVSFARTQRAGLLLTMGRWEDALQEYTQVREDTQEHPSTAAYARAMSAALQGDWEQAERIAEDHLADMPTDPLTGYNMACAWALFADLRVRKFQALPSDPQVILYKQRALALLEKTFQVGYTDRWHTVHDPDLFCLHREAAFWQIVGTSRPFTEP
uniref:Tetratricopeptide repeat protein n=1 Tax=uncultured Planctomycetota bacterium TaxID=120965 RepID=H5SBZ3_9BACT|nr:hypothetical protein HGMM_F07G10C07 [uncultured Planctomycetota bacterium]